MNLRFNIFDLQLLNLLHVFISYAAHSHSKKKQLISSTKQLVQLTYSIFAEHLGANFTLCLPACMQVPEVRNTNEFGADTSINVSFLVTE